MDYNEFVEDQLSSEEDQYHASPVEFEINLKITELVKHTLECQDCQKVLKEHIRPFGETYDVITTLDFRNLNDWMCYKKKNRSLNVWTSQQLKEEKK